MKYVTLLGLAAFAPTLGTAQSLPVDQEPFAHPPGFVLSYGLGFVGTSGVYTGQGDAVLPTPTLAFTYDRVSVNLAKGISYQFLDNAETKLSGALVYNLGPDVPDTALFAGWDRKDWVGAQLDVWHDCDLFDVAVTHQFDVSGVHGGDSTTVSLGRSFALGAGLFEARIGGTYLNQKQATYLYGVSPGEATATRPAYQVQSNWTPHLDLSATYPVSGKTAITAFFRHENLPDEITNSPLVAADERTTIGLSLIRTF